SRFLRKSERGTKPPWTITRRQPRARPSTAVALPMPCAQPTTNATGPENGGPASLAMSIAPFVVRRTFDLNDIRPFVTAAEVQSTVVVPLRKRPLGVRRGFTENYRC